MRDPCRGCCSPRDRARDPGPDVATDAAKAGLRKPGATSLRLAISAHQVLARSLLTGGRCRSLSRCLPRFRIHENSAVSVGLAPARETTASGRIRPRARRCAADRSRCEATRHWPRCPCRSERWLVGRPLRRSRTGGVRPAVVRWSLPSGHFLGGHPFARRLRKSQEPAWVRVRAMARCVDGELLVLADIVLSVGLAWVAAVRAGVLVGAGSGCRLERLGLVGPR